VELSDEAHTHTHTHAHAHAEENYKKIVSLPPEEPCQTSCSGKKNRAMGNTTVHLPIRLCTSEWQQKQQQSKRSTYTVGSATVHLPIHRQQ